MPIAFRPFESPRLTAAVAVVLAGLAGGAAYHQLAWKPEHAQRERGAALFRGEVPLAGRLARHGADLPTLATRCVNCHEASSPAPGAPASAAQAYAMMLNGSGLAEARPRRGGPPSRYDAASLCELLRNGVDPARVIIVATMPRYQVSDAQCDDLWAYLRAR